MMSARADSTINMKTIAVFSQKGGSGKSTVAIHLAVLASQRCRVLLVDADPQGTTTQDPHQSPGPGSARPALGLGALLPT